MSINNNVLAAGVLVAGALVFSSAAQAASANYMDSNWVDNAYVGLDFSKISIDYRTEKSVVYDDVYDSSFTGMNPYLGYHFDDSWSAEVGYMETNDNSKTVGTTSKNSLSISGMTKVELRTWHLDGVYKYSIGNNLSALLSAGIERTHFRTTNDLTTTEIIKGSDRSTGLRAGWGLGFNFHEDLAGRVMVRYSTASFDKIADSTLSYSIGLAYSF